MTKLTVNTFNDLDSSINFADELRRYKDPSNIRDSVNVTEAISQDKTTQDLVDSVNFADDLRKLKTPNQIKASSDFTSNLGTVLTADNITDLSDGGSFVLINDVELDLASLNKIVLSNSLTVSSINPDSKIIVNGTGNLFGVAANNIKFYGVNFDSADGANIFDFNNIPFDINGFEVNGGTSNGVYNLAYCNNELSSIYTLKDAKFLNLKGRNLKNSLIRLSGIYMDSVEVDNIDIIGTKRHGVYVGYMKDDGSGNTLDTLKHITINKITVKNINPDSDPGGEGSNGVYASGSHVEISNVEIINHYALDNVSYSNMEPVYTKAKYYKVHDVKTINTSSSQGSIAIKGISANDDVNCEISEVYDNTFINESKSAPFNASTGLWIQASKVNIRDNTFVGLNYRTIVCFSGGLQGGYMDIKNSTFDNCSGDYMYNINGTYDYLTFGNGDKYINSERTSYFIFANFSPDSVIGRLDLGCPFIDPFSAGNLSSINYVRIQDTADLGVVKLKDAVVKYGNNFFLHEGTVFIDEMRIFNSSFEGVDNLMANGVAGVTKAFTGNIDGAFFKKGPIPLISNISAGAQIQSNVITVKGARGGDELSYGFDLPDNVYILGAQIIADDSVRFYMRNNSASDHNLLATDGFIKINKAGTMIDGIA